MANVEPGFLIVAAGQSRRFGANKLMAELPAGKAVFQQTFENIVQAANAVNTDKIAVVVRPNFKGIIRYLLQQGLQEQVLPLASSGIGESIAFGVQANTHWDGWMICLADMPYISSDTYRDVYRRTAADNIVRPCFASGAENQVGHPVCFGKQFCYELTSLRGDNGAKSIIDRHPEKLMTVASDRRVILDIDRPRDLFLQ